MDQQTATAATGSASITDDNTTIIFMAADPLRARSRDIDPGNPVRSIASAGDAMKVPAGRLIRSA
jgi:hypothetical protein